MADIFLSYSSKDRPAAEAIERALTARGIDVFWDQETPAGQDWDTWIRAKLAAAKIAVVLWSRHSIASDNVRHEALVARKANKLLPVVIDQLAPEDLPMGLYMVQSVVVHDWRAADSKGIARLAAEIEARLGKTPGAAPSPPPAAGARVRISPIGIAIGLLLVGAGSAWMWWANQPKTPPAEAAITSTSDPAATAASAAPPFSKKLVGHWRWDLQQLCSQAVTISMQGGQLIVSAKDSQDFVHVIDTDTTTETRTHVVSPEIQKGHIYRFAQKPVQPNAPEGFTLVVEDVSEPGDHNEWTPCTVKQ